MAIVHPIENRLAEIVNVNHSTQKKELRNTNAITTKENILLKISRIEDSETENLLAKEEMINLKTLMKSA
ncbi:hypothetical protein D3C86_1934940 [compost metagenome]